MANEDDVRRIALSLPQAWEKPYNRLPGFRVRSRLFARIHELPGVLMVGVRDLEEKAELLAAQPRTYFSTPHYDGYPGVLVRLDEIEPDELAEVLTEAWRLVAPRRLLAEFDAEQPAGPPA